MEEVDQWKGAKPDAQQSQVNRCPMSSHSTFYFLPSAILTAEEQSGELERCG